MNNQLTRQDLQLQLQQTLNTILNKTMTRDEFNNIAQNITQRMCTRLDTQSYIDCAKQKFLEKLTVPINEQRMLYQQIYVQIEVFNKTLTRLELKIDSLQESIKALQSQSKTVMSRNQNNPARTLLEQMYA